MSKFFLFLGVILTVLAVSACDRMRTKKCEWYLIPEPDHIYHVKEGWVPLCARNPVNRKQKCMFQAKLKFAEDVYGVKFRLSELKYEEKPLPRKILEVKPCK